MKLLINESQIKFIIENTFNDEYDFYDYKTENLYDIFDKIKNKEKIIFRRIHPNQYKNALLEFIRYGMFNRFPESVILKWKSLMIKNTIMLLNLTEIHGHTQHFPFDEFYDAFDIPEEEQDHDFGEAFDLLDEKYNMDEYVPHFSSGHPVISDFALGPLLKQCQILMTQNSPEEIIVTINKMLDITHPRGDIAELFIIGGSKSLDVISNK